MRSGAHRSQRRTPRRRHGGRRWPTDKRNEFARSRVRLVAPFCRNFSRIEESSELLERLAFALSFGFSLLSLDIGLGRLRLQSIEPTLQHHVHHLFYFSGLVFWDRGPPILIKVRQQQVSDRPVLLILDPGIEKEGPSIHRMQLPAVVAGSVRRSSLMPARSQYFGVSLQERTIGNIFRIASSLDGEIMQALCCT